MLGLEGICHGRQHIFLVTLQVLRSVNKCILDDFLEKYMRVRVLCHGRQHNFLVTPQAFRDVPKRKA